MHMGYLAVAYIVHIRNLAPGIDEVAIVAIEEDAQGLDAQAVLCLCVDHRARGRYGQEHRRTEKGSNEIFVQFFLHIEI